jgi:apolipoprotein N-acyltransferase
MTLYAFMHSNRFKYYMLSLLLGGLLPFAFAPVHFYVLALVIPGLLAFAWHRLSMRQTLISAFLFGFAFFSVGVSWIYITLERYGGMAAWLALGVTVLLMVVLALFFVAQAFFTQLFSKNRLAYFLIVFPIMWVFFEWLRSTLFSGFPWLFLGYSQISSLLGGIAPIFGVYGVSIFTLWTSSAIALLIFDKAKGHKILAGVILGIIFIITLLSSLSGWTRPASQAIQVSLIQGNIEQSIKWNAEDLSTSLTRYYNLTQSHWNSALIIWPEAAIPTLKETIIPYMNALDYLAQKNHSMIIAGIPVAKTQKNKVHYYNGLITLGEKEPQTYLKKHLVPFGEYIPLRPLFGWFLNAVHIPMTDQTPGPQKQPLFKVNSFTIAPFICYEIAYPAQVLNSAQGSNLILVVTDDSWFGQSMAPYQHLQIAQMRARELGRYVLFSTNSGITAVINPNGYIIQSLSPDKTDTLTTHIVPVEGKTPLMRWRYYPLVIMLLILFFVNFWL